MIAISVSHKNPTRTPQKPPSYLAGRATCVLNKKGPEPFSYKKISEVGLDRLLAYREELETHRALCDILSNTSPWESSLDESLLDQLDELLPN